MFDKGGLDPAGVCALIDYNVSEFLIGRREGDDISGNSGRMVSSVEKWPVPSEGFLKVNVDGAFKAISGKGGIGVIVRDESGCVIDGFSGSCRVALALMAEVVLLGRLWVSLKAWATTGCSLNRTARA